MIDHRRTDPAAPEDGPPETECCALLDEYWEGLQHHPEPDSRRWLEERDLPDATIVGDLDVLRRLYLLRRSAGVEDDAPRARSVAEAEPFGSTPGSRASSPGPLGAGDPVAGPIGGPASGPTVAHARGECPVGSASAPGEGTPAVGAGSQRRIGKYLVVELLDSGGQGQVFRVLHPELAKELVLKLAWRPMAIGSDGQGSREELLREGRLLAQCDHPNLVRVVDLDVHEGRPFVVMEHVIGLTLRQYADQQDPGPRAAARLVAELARAVAYLHDRGIIHQDITPRNVLVDERGRPRLIDFGLARQSHAWSEGATRSIGGTASYMSPEQTLGQAERIGPPTDVFGLGGLLYHLLTGRPLYQGASRVSVLRQAMKAEFVPVRQVAPRVPRALERICHKALAFEPGRRHGTAVEMERALRRFLARRRVAAAGLVLVSLMAVALAASAFLPGGPPPRIVSFVVDQSRGDPPHPFGPIGLSARPVLVDDDVRVSARLDAPAYCYLIALDPDGKVESCWPPGREGPPRSSLVRFPTGEKDYFGLTDGPGIQAFVLVAARRPLPPFGLWKGGDGLRPRWKPAVADGIWSYDGRGFRLLSSVSRGELRERSGSAPPAPFREVCEYLQTLEEVEAVQAVAFPVRPKAGGPPPVEPRPDAP